MVFIVRQERMDELKREKLISAALEEFAISGLENASYNRIIERSGLSKGSVYYYFDNKDSLLSMVLEQISTGFINSMSSFELPTSKEEYWQKFYEYNQKAFSYFINQPLSVQVMFMLLSNAEFPDRHFSAFDKVFSSSEQLIQTGIDLGAVRSDLSHKTIRLLMYSIRRVLTISIFKENDIENINNVDENKVNGLLSMMYDFSKRMLTPKEEHENV